MFSPFVFVLMVLCAFRATRFVVYDSLIGSHLESGTKWSQRLDRWAFETNGTDKNFVVAKFATLASCVWCAGVWLSWGTVAVFAWVWPWELRGAQWGLVVAVAGAQAMLSTASHKWIER